MVGPQTYWARAVTAEAAQAIDSRPILPNRCMNDEKAGRSGARIALIEALRIVLWGRAVAGGFFAWVFIGQFTVALIL